MVLVFTRFDLGKQGFDKNIEEITANDMMLSSLYKNALYSATTILFHDTTKSGNWKVLKWRGDDTRNYHNLVINKYNKGVLIDVLTDYHG